MCGGTICPLADNQVLTVMWSLEPLLSEYACFVFRDAANFSVLRSIATMDSSQLNMFWGFCLREICQLFLRTGQNAPSRHLN